MELRGLPQTRRTALGALACVAVGCGLNEDTTAQDLLTEGLGDPTGFDYVEDVGPGAFQAHYTFDINSHSPGELESCDGLAAVGLTIPEGLLLTEDNTTNRDCSADDYEENLLTLATYEGSYGGSECLLAPGVPFLSRGEISFNISARCERK